MIKLDKAIIVEGKYDKIRLSGFIDAVIIETDGFRIFSNEEKKALIRRIAKTNGIIVMTDSDAAGFKIRNHIRNIAADGEVINVYIPDVFGKEKRKAEPSKEGKLGVEGLSEEIITSAMEKAGVYHTQSDNTHKRQVTATDLFEDGLTGTDNAKERKYKLLSVLGLPSRMSNSQLLKLINTFMSYEDYKRAVAEISDGAFLKTKGTNIV
ncbi:MAG: DUF4093 domain-containing protein [Clostridia bacterium]|nr:DUF4093 domain-containing protein [Clostridia bacterium]